MAHMTALACTVIPAQQLSTLRAVVLPLARFLQASHCDAHCIIVAIVLVW